MLATLNVKTELRSLIEFVETGLLSPALVRRLGHFPPQGLTSAARDMLDWLSIRAIVRGNSPRLFGPVHPLAGRLIAQLPGLSQCLCVPDGRLAYRVELAAELREELEDFVMDRIWHRRWTGKGRLRERDAVVV